MSFRGAPPPSPPEDGGSSREQKDVVAVEAREFEALKRMVFVLSKRRRYGLDEAWNVHPEPLRESYVCEKMAQDAIQDDRERATVVLSEEQFPKGGGALCAQRGEMLAQRTQGAQFIKVKVFRS